jgi:hypothetical protein
MRPPVPLKRHQINRRSVPQKRCVHCGADLIPGPNGNWSISLQTRFMNLCRKCYATYQRTYASRPDRRKAQHESAKRYKLKIRLEVLGHYSGGGPPRCVRCGFTDIRALTIDHVRGDGHLEPTRNGGYRFYLTLRRRGYPSDFQTLCMNCQFIKRVENHEYGNLPPIT